MDANSESIGCSHHGRNTEMHRSFLYIIVALLMGCAGSGIVQVSPDTYMIAQTDKRGIFGNPSKMKASVIRQANEFAISQGKVAIPVSTKETPLIVNQRFASIEYQFRVVSEDDAEYRRTSLSHRADLTIQDNKDIQITVDDARTRKTRYAQLQQLEELRKSGVLTQAEFNSEKSKLLNSPN